MNMSQQDPYKGIPIQGKPVSLPGNSMSLKQFGLNPHLPVIIGLTLGQVSNFSASVSLSICRTQ